MRRATRFFNTVLRSGVGGLYDYGPTGCAIMANLIAEWRQHFVLEENMLEINCTAMTPYYVLECVGKGKRMTLGGRTVL